MADLRYGPEPVFGSCADGDPESYCRLIVNTTLYPVLVVELGPVWEQLVSRGTQWFTVILSIFMTLWFIYNFYTGHCGWEVIFVTTIEFIKILIEVFFEYETPCMIYSVFGPVTSWLRYIEWLLTCPVILIHLSNLTGLDEEYSARTMGLLTSDQGTICFGVTAALSRNGVVKVITFLTALCFGVSTFYSASRVYIESYHQVPKGLCRRLVRYLTAMFFCSWLMFPLLFLAGPEGLAYLTWSGSTIGHTVADLLSKNIWGLIAHYLQVKIREHIILHGDVRAKVEKTVAGHTFEVEGFRDEEDDNA
nr:protein 115 [synthetic construct]